jgi:hypothetical protein
MLTAGRGPIVKIRGDLTVLQEQCRLHFACDRKINSMLCGTSMNSVSGIRSMTGGAANAVAFSSRADKSW